MESVDTLLDKDKTLQNVTKPMENNCSRQLEQLFILFYSQGIVFL